MRIGETALDMELRHVSEQERRIAHQKVLIEHLRKIGAPLDDAFNLLSSMQYLLETMLEHLARLQN